jgi:hypothetical protein
MTDNARAKSGFEMTDNVLAFLRLLARIQRRIDGLPELPVEDDHAIL